MDYYTWTHKCKPTSKPLYVDSGCRLEDLPRLMADRNGWGERAPRVESVCISLRTVTLGKGMDASVLPLPQL